MSCREIQNRIGESDLHLPFPTEIEAHLSGCARCEAYARELRLSEAWLIRTARTPAVTPEMEGVLNRLRTQVYGAAENGSRPAPSSSLWKFKRSRKEADMQTEASKFEAHSAHPRNQPRRSNWKWATGLAFAVLLGGGAGFWVTQPKTGGHAAQGSNSRTTLSPAKRAADKERSVNNLKQLGMALFMFTEEHDGRLPSMDDPEAVKQALLRYIDGDLNQFHSPVTGKPYGVNQWIGGRQLTSFASPAEIVTIFETEPDEEGKRRVVYIDGHVNTLNEAEWEAAREKSSMP